MEWISNPEIWISLLTLTILEVVLGIDNIVFITILADKLPESEREKARQVGMVLAMIMRIGLLLSISWLIGLTEPIFSIGSFIASGRDLILFSGGLFLIGKSTYEIHHKLEGLEGEASSSVIPKFRNIIIQILLLDIVFSLDSVITAIGMADEVGVMIAAVIISVIVMLLSVSTISKYISDHPTLKILALSFLLLIGFSLMAEGLHQHIEKGYVYSAMGFSVFVEILNIRAKNKSLKPVKLRKRYTRTKKKAQ